MSEAAKEARRKMHEKAKRLTTAESGKVDASDFDAYPDLNADVATGARPLSRRQFRKGGRVETRVDGADAKHHMGRKPRKSGGSALTADSLINRDVREANEKREGVKHVGGFKRGGAPKHSDEKEDRALVKKMVRKESLTGKREGGKVGKSVGGALEDAFVPGALLSDIIGGHVGKGYKRGGSLDGAMQGTRPKGGRTARASGGRAKGKTNINIVIDAQPKTPGMQPPIGAVPMGPNGLAGPGAGGAMPIPVPMGGGAPPPAAPMPMPMPMPPQGAPMPRKSGGRAEYKLDDGAGGGKGRLEKLRWYGRRGAE